MNRPLAAIAWVALLTGIALFVGLVIGRVTAPDRGMTWAELEALACPAEVAP